MEVPGAKKAKLKKEAPSTTRSSTPEERGKGEAIIKAAFGAGFTADFHYPKNVGTQGDERVYGDTVAIVGLGKLSSSERRRWYEARVVGDTARRDVEADEQGRVRHEDDRLGEVSRELTNTLPAVTKVLLDITPEH